MKHTHIPKKNTLTESKNMKRKLKNLVRIQLILEINAISFTSKKPYCVSVCFHSEVALNWFDWVEFGSLVAVVFLLSRLSNPCQSIRILNRILIFRLFVFSTSRVWSLCMCPCSSCEWVSVVYLLLLLLIFFATLFLICFLNAVEHGRFQIKFCHTVRYVDRFESIINETWLKSKTKMVFLCFCFTIEAFSSSASLELFEIVSMHASQPNDLIIYLLSKSALAVSFSFST